MVTALVFINAERGKINEAAQQLLEIDGVVEVYSVSGEYDRLLCCVFSSMICLPML